MNVRKTAETNYKLLEKVSPKMAEFCRRNDAHIENNRKILKEFVKKRIGDFLPINQRIYGNALESAKGKYSETDNIFKAAKTFVKSGMNQRVDYQKQVWKENKQLLSDIKLPTYNAIKEMTNK